MFGNLLKKLSTPPPLQVGKKNLDRAWRATMNNDMDMARRFNTKAAEAFRTMLTIDRDKGKNTFPPRLAAAGIAILRDGDPKTAAPLLALAVASQKILFPAYVWAGLAYAQLGDQDTALKFWNAYQGIQAGQPILNKIVMEQRMSLETGQTDLQNACRAVEEGLLLQDKADFREGRGFWLTDRL